MYNDDSKKFDIGLVLFSETNVPGVPQKMNAELPSCKWTFFTGHPVYFYYVIH